MSVSIRQYAYLADHSYGRDERGNTVDLKSLVGKETTIGGIRYEVLAYSDRPSGYQGAVYQRVDTGEIIVAHRGTEFDRQTMDGRIKPVVGMLPLYRDGCATLNDRKPLALPQSCGDR